jgi:hypothetical protein
VVGDIVLSERQAVVAELEFQEVDLYENTDYKRSDGGKASAFGA